MMLFWFVAVLALIPLSLWWLKRSGLAGGRLQGTAALMQPVAQHVLGPGQRVVTLEVGAGADKVWLVLGVTAQQITPLHTMAPQPLPARQGQPMPLQAAFAKVLQDRLGKAPSASTPRPGDQS